MIDQGSSGSVVKDADVRYGAGAEEVVDIGGGGGGGGGLTQIYLWFGELRPKKKKRSQPTYNSFPPHQLRIYS